MDFADNALFWHHLLITAASMLSDETSMETMNNSGLFQDIKCVTFSDSTYKTTADKLSAKY